jgi:hypothetical protein
MYIHIFKWLHTYVQTCFNCFIFCNGLIPMYINWIRYIFWDGFIDMHICTYICWTTGDIRFADERSSPLPYCIFLIVYIPINWACCKMLKMRVRELENNWLVFWVGVGDWCVHFLVELHSFIKSKMLTTHFILPINCIWTHLIQRYGYTIATMQITLNNHSL